jgi:hypothetical protein
MSLKNTLLTFSLLVILSISSFGQIKFNFSKDEQDFGIAEEGTILNTSFDFINDGKDTIHLKEESRDVRPGCSCTASEYSKEPIPPGGKGFVKAGYHTQGRIGNFNKTITISQKGTPYKILTIKGIVVKKSDPPAIKSPSRLPVLVLEKKGHDFGKIQKSKAGIYRVSIKNNGKDTLKFISTASACQCIKYKFVNPKDNSELKYVLQGKSAFLEISYLPNFPSSPLSDFKTFDIFTIFTNDPKNQKIELPLQSEIVEK